MNPWVAGYLGMAIGAILGLLAAGMGTGAKRADAQLDALEHLVCRDCGQPGDAWDESCPVCGGKVEVTA
jgi:rubrerythrin